MDGGKWEMSMEKSPKTNSASSAKAGFVGNVVYHKQH